MYLRKANGFTLVELMIVIAIVGILGAFAIPSYNAYVEKSRRADGTAGLLGAANILERCATVNGAYNHANCGAGVVPANSPDQYYAIALTAVGASTFTLTVTPQGAQADDADQCPSMSITQAGVKTPDPDTERCWGQ